MRRKSPMRAHAAIQQAEITHLSHDGRGIARIDGKATFIQGALPDELVTFQYTRVKKDFDEGKLVDVLRPAPLRVVPRCPHYTVCGGCSLQHIDEQEQIHLKQEHLLDLLSRYGHTKPQELLPPLKSAHWNYRNKARLSVRFVEKKQVAMVGFRERHNPRYITDISQCPILNAKVDADIVVLKQLVAQIEDKSSIAQIEVAAGDDEVALILRHLTPLSVQDEEIIRQFAQQHHYKIFLQPGGPETVHCFYPPQSSEYLTYRLPDYGISFQFHPTDFTQVNAALNRSMVALALSLMDLKRTDVVLDLFCGLGNFSLPMAQLCSKLVGIEGSSTMVERASMNAQANNIHHATFAAANLDDVAQVRALAKQAYNKMLLDPPRSGALAIVSNIESFNPERIVYVSCNPVTLARDIDVLVNQKGYVLVNAGVMDMFPHTAHVESIALLKRNEDVDC